MTHLPIFLHLVLSSAYYPVPFQQGADFCIFSPETSVQDIRIFGAAFREDVFTKRTGCLPVEDSRLFEDRESIGIQDFNKQVLQTVHRQAPLLQPEEIVTILRSCGVRINMDFLYGLPHQTEASFAETIEKAVSLKPDRLVTFSYAHVPWAFPRQKVLEKTGLPSGDEKSRMFEAARKILCEADYQPIGLDHFVRKDDELYTALLNGQLHRNFQGYCTRRTTGQVYAFGVTGISQLGTAYAQNTKDIMKYIEKVEAGILPVAKGYLLSREEQITREAIEMLMCNYRIDWNELGTAFRPRPLHQAGNRL